VPVGSLPGGCSSGFARFPAQGIAPRSRAPWDGVAEEDQKQIEAGDFSTDSRKQAS